MRVKIADLKKDCVEILTRKGLTQQQANLVFDEYLDGELRGRTCHGFMAFAKFGAKLVDFEGPPEILKEEDNALYIDGRKNLGQIVCHEYVPRLIEKAKNKYIAMMGIYNMHAYLMPGTFARMIANSNLIGFVFNYGGAPRIAPYGSIDPVFATNPIAVGIPSNDFPIVVDMATSKIAMGKVRLADRLGEEISPGVAMDKNGNETNSPAEAMAGALFPFDKGAKGSALALVVEILSKTMFDINIAEKTKANRGFLFIVINPAFFQEIDHFKSNVSQLIKEIKSKRKAEGVEEIFLPGEHSERLKKINQEKDYLEIDEKIIGDIKGLL